MIAKLTGILDSVGADHAVIDVGGVGYLVFCSARTLNGLGATGQRVIVLVDTHVREDAITLYGFADGSERDLFRLLITVQGVGARVANALLSVLSPDDLLRSIAAQDRVALTRADGVGPKLATRILSELKDKVGGAFLGPAAAAATPVALAGAVKVPDGGALADAVSALVHLGYARTEAFGAAMTARQALGPEAAVPALIRQSLKALGAER